MVRISSIHLLDLSFGDSTLYQKLLNHPSIKLHLAVFGTSAMENTDFGSLKPADKTKQRPSATFEVDMVGQLMNSCSYTSCYRSINLSGGIHKVFAMYRLGASKTAKHYCN
ncbi:hypothetical protein Tco_0092271 [Tanacetum coccineum]